MPELDITTDLRAGADNIHSIGPVQAANLLRAAAETIDALRRDFAEARQLASRYGIELGPHFAAHGEHATTTERRTNIPYLGTEPLVERRIDPEASLLLDNVTSEEAHRLLGLDKVQPHILGVWGRISVGGDPEAIASLGLAEERGCQPGACLAEPRCRNRAEMRAAHGNPAEFAAAIARAAPELLGSEAERAIVTYNAAWATATEPSAEVQRALNSELEAMGCNPASATRAEFKRALWGASKRVEMGTMLAEVEAHLAVEEPGTPGDGLADIRSVELDIPPMPVQLAEHRRRAALGLSLDGSVDATGRHLGDVIIPIAQPGVDLWPGSGLPPLMSTTTIGALRSFAPEPEPTYEATCTACEGEQFEGAICNACGDHVELAGNGDGTFRRIYHSPAQIEQFTRSED